jgi:hypothetical protein
MSSEAHAGLSPALRLRGVAQCRRWGDGWCIEGRDADTDELVQIRLSGVAQSLPARLADGEFSQHSLLANGATRCLLRDASQPTPLLLNARAVQVHRDVAHIFYQALPPVPVSPATRLGWWLLLNLLRLPGLAPWLQRLRGRT